MTGVDGYTILKPGGSVRPSRRAAVNLWAAGFAGSAVIQGLLPRGFARHTAWGHNGGWQREIAIWNLGILTIVGALRRDPTDVDGGLIAGFAVLSTLFGLNHLRAAVKAPGSIGNWAGVAANGVGLGFGVAALSERAARRS